MAARSEAPTMKVVAQRANVSVQTVSAVINGKPGITEPTRIRVLEAIRDLGYRPYYYDVPKSDTTIEELNQCVIRN